MTTPNDSLKEFRHYVEFDFAIPNILQLKNIEDEIWRTFGK